MPQTTSKGSRSRDLVSAGSELLSPYRAKRNVVIKKSLSSVFRWTASIVRWIYNLEAPSPESTFAFGQKCASLPVLLVDYVVVPSFHSLGMVSVLLNSPFIRFIWSPPSYRYPHLLGPRGRKKESNWDDPTDSYQLFPMTS